MIITLVDDTDLSMLGKGQQARTYELYSMVARKAEIRLVTQEARYPERLAWVSELRVVGSLPGKGSAWVGSLSSLAVIAETAKGSDVIIAEHIYGVNRWAPLASRLSGLQFVYDSHGNEAEVCKSLACIASVTPFEKAMYKSADAIIAISDKVLEKAWRLYKVKTEKQLVLVPGLRGVSCRGKGRLRTSLSLWGVRESEVVAVMHGSLRYGPNMDALKALLTSSSGSRERHGVIFVVAGSSDMRPGWLSDSVLYVGFVNDVDDLLCSADVAVSLNVSGTGVHMKVIDYLSAGLVLVATPKSLEGIPAVALEGYPLALVSPGSDLGETVATLAERARGPFSGRAKLPTWDEQASKLLNFLSSV
ncbi:glycosyltransferase [Acidilobus sp.]|uniref:glycosyltransferase n=1 Tax=Acidilobus sp. TaxID=1872109 RepID=UPI003D06F4D8